MPASHNALCFNDTENIVTSDFDVNEVHACLLLASSASKKTLLQGVLRLTSLPILFNSIHSHQSRVSDHIFLVSHQCMCYGQHSSCKANTTPRATNWDTTSCIHCDVKGLWGSARENKWEIYDSDDRSVGILNNQREQSSNSHIAIQEVA